jgi:Methionine biosynthesis protein MetW
VSEVVPETTRLMAEIDEEVRRKRASGELPADFERELDLAFARYAPVDAVEGDFDSIVAKLEVSTVIDTEASTESSRPGVAQIKTGVAKAVGWYVRHVASQTSGLFHATAKALRLLGDRVDALEAGSPAAATRAWREVRTSRATNPLPPGPWDNLLIETMKAAPGRVLHGECGDGSLVAALQAAGVDAYGVEPDDDLALDAADRADDVRADDVVGHLRLLSPASLGGLVLSGCVERLPAGTVADLADMASAKLAPGGAIAIVSGHPDAWRTSRDPVEVDLSPGRPLHPETWEAILSSRPFEQVTVHQGPRQRGLDPVDKAATTINANLGRLNDLLFGPVSYAVVAQRAR